MSKNANTKKVDENEVLDFLDSLPSKDASSSKNSNEKLATAAGAAAKAGSSAAVDGENADILDFLDELAQESKATNTSFKPAVKRDPAKKQNDTVLTKMEASQESIASPSEKIISEKKETITTKEGIPNDSSTEPDAADEGFDPSTAPDAADEGFDPLSSISGWWGNSGSKQLNSLWGSASHVVGDLQKTAQSTVEDLQKNTQSGVQILQNTAKTTVQDIGQLANDQLKDLKLLDDDDSENLKKFNQGINTRVGGLLSSFVHSINEQIEISGGATEADSGEDETETIKLYMINDQLKNFSYIDYLLYNKFDQVVSQVEGSINLELVNSKTFSKLLNFLDLASIANSDHDLKPKQIDFFKGSLFDAEKLLFANIDEGIKSLMEFKKQKQQQEQQEGSDAKEEQQLLQQQGKNNTSHVFISVLPIIQELAGSSAAKYSSALEKIYKIDESSGESFQFMFVLKDLEHKFSIVTRSQALPVKWAQWLTTNKMEDVSGEEFEGVEPEEWIRVWIKDSLGLSFGVLAQDYIVKRMGF